MNKSELRKKAKKIRDSILDRQKKEEAINTALIEYVCKQQTEVIAVYMSIRSEVSIYPLIEYLLSSGVQVVAPMCVHEQLEFCAVSSLSDFKTGSFGILEPTFSPAQKSNISSKEIDVVLVPGLMFDLEGHRLGYGAGYYDRYLSEYNGISCGVAFEEQIAERLPYEAHDQKLGALVTPRGIRFL